MAKKSSTVKAGRAKIKGTNAADKQNIAAGKAAGRADADKAATDKAAARTEAAPSKTPGQVSPREARAAAQKMFDKADAQGKAEIIEDIGARKAALGY